MSCVTRRPRRCDAPPRRQLPGSLHGLSRTAPETGTDHISLKLDDQTFNASVYASPVQGGKGEHGLI